MGPNEVDWKYYACPDFRKKLGNALKPSQVKVADYDCIYFAGGHGVVFDFYQNKQLHDIARQIYDKGGIISSVCHGVVGLINLKDSHGQWFVKGKKITGFSNDQEKEVQLDKHVPFLTQTELKNHGAVYSQAANWQPYIVVDGRLISGQNPGSSAGVAEAILHYKWN